jgi:hypothetical protein
MTLTFNICQALFHGHVDHLMSHITFSQNCVVIHKKDRVGWCMLTCVECRVESARR